ncbi:hypothetical protein FGIG_04149 [Fasciola gigantica]|uniref:Uncharacterized protein n=1 Tax=Fasciola gigantica TaxID=46835 RepID=A0A504Z5U1_FASGI|nr:hypothetical protein FGIG_04149 [Fasciola gigantica]
MLQATASLIAEARAEEQGRLLSSYLGDKIEPVGDGTPKQEYNRRSGYTLTARLRTRVCSDSCLKVVYLSCATLISASFIVECILLHLIIVPYLSESVFEAGACRYISSRSEMKKRCENKCSKERSYFPCLQISVLFTPFRQMITVPGGSFLNTTTIMGSDSASNNMRSRFLSDGSLSSPNEVFWDSSRWRDLTKETMYNLNTSGSRMVYLYDYFSTFAAHKTARVSQNGF